MVETLLPYLESFIGDYTAFSAVLLPCMFVYLCVPVCVYLLLQLAIGYKIDLLVNSSWSASSASAANSSGVFFFLIRGLSDSAPAIGSSSTFFLMLYCISTHRQHAQVHTQDLAVATLSGWTLLLIGQASVR